MYGLATVSILGTFSETKVLTVLILERLASAIQQSLSVTDKYGPLLGQAV